MCNRKTCTTNTGRRGVGMSVYLLSEAGAYSHTLKTPVLDNYHQRRITVLHTKLKMFLQHPMSSHTVSQRLVSRLRVHHTSCHYTREKTAEFEVVPEPGGIYSIY